MFLSEPQPFQRNKYVPKVTNVYLLLLENKIFPSFSYLIIPLNKDVIILW